MSDFMHDSPTVEVRTWVVYRSNTPSGSRMLCPKSEHPPPEGFAFEDECQGTYDEAQALLERLTADEYARPTLDIGSAP